MPIYVTGSQIFQQMPIVQLHPLLVGIYFYFTVYICYVVIYEFFFYIPLCIFIDKEKKSRKISLLILEYSNFEKENFCTFS